MRARSSELRLVIFTCLLVFAGSGPACAQNADEELSATLRLVAMVQAQVGGSPVFGSGIVFRREEDRIYIVTANHVVRRGTDEASQIRVNLRSLPAKPLLARLLPQNDREMDIAVLSVDNLASQGVDVCKLRLDRLGHSDLLKRGSEVFPVGNPNGAAWGMPAAADHVASVSDGEIAFQSPVVTVGFSGGALLDVRSLLVAMVRRDEPPFGLAIPLDRILRRLDEWGYPAHIWTPVEGGLTPLHTAVGSLAKTRALLAEACADPNPVDRQGRTPLHYAADAGNLETARLLLQAGAKVDVQSGGWETPLNDAAAKGHAEMIRLLLSAGASPNSRVRRPETPLYDALMSRSLESVRLLVAAGADVNRLSGDRPPLGIAVEHGTPQMVALLVDAGANVNATTRGGSMVEVAADRGSAAMVSKLISAGAQVKGTKALENAVRRNALEVIRLLLAAGADPEGRLPTGQRILHVAAKEGRIEAMKLVLAAGARVNAEDGLNRTPLHAAVDGGSPAAVSLLLDAGASILASSSGAHTGDSPLCAAYSSRKRDPDPAARQEILRILIARSGNQIDILVGDSGCRLFERAAADGDVETVQALLSAGANPNRDTTQPLIHAAENGRANVVSLLIAAKANLNAADINGYTALHRLLDQPYRSLTEGDLETLRLLLTAGARVNTVVGYNGSTPLHTAVERRAPAEVVRLLIAKGADPRARNSYGETPLSIAVQQGLSEVVAILRAVPPAGTKR